jgi:hypothetical protein
MRQGAAGGAAQSGGLQASKGPQHCGLGRTREDSKGLPIERGSNKCPWEEDKRVGRCWRHSTVALRLEGGSKTGHPA